jgi:hypothetical protein
MAGSPPNGATMSRLKNLGLKLRNRIVLRSSNYIFRNFENYDNVSIYPNHGLIYNRIKKSGNTTITAFLGDVLAGTRYECASDLKRKLVRPGDLSVAELRSLPNFYSFTFVRDPYDRVLSAYLGAALDRKRSGSSRVRNGLRRFYFDREGRDHFHEFLEFLDSGGLYADRHWWPQVDLLVQPVKDFSFVGRLENLVTDMKVVLRAAGVSPDLSSRLVTPHALELKDGNKIRSAGMKTEAYYSPRTCAIVERLYERDFEIFKYPRFRPD